MKPSVRRALESVSAISEDAALLVHKLKGDEGVISQLKERITTLQSEVAALRMELSNKDQEQLTDDDIDALRTALYAAFSKRDTTALSAFTRARLQPYPPQVRVVFASVLNNIYHERNLKPHDEWLDILASGGEL